MGTLNVRIDPDLEQFVEQLARQTGCSKSDVVRLALETLRDKEAERSEQLLSAALARIIGSGDSGGMNLSERTGDRFYQMLKEQQRIERESAPRRRRPPRRTH